MMTAMRKRAVIACQTPASPIELGFTLLDCPKTSLAACPEVPDSMQPKFKEYDRPETLVFGRLPDQLLVYWFVN
jgi:hypothetical protein